MDYQNYLKQLLTLTIDKGASDVHFSIKHPPVFRINRKLIPLAKEKPLTAEDTQNLAFCLMKEDQRIMLIKQKDMTNTISRTKAKTNFIFSVLNI